MAAVAILKNRNRKLAAIIEKQKDKRMENHTLIPHFLIFQDGGRPPSWIFKSGKVADVFNCLEGQYA